MNLHCFFYTTVKNRSLYRSSLECSNGSKSTYSTQLTKIAQLQRLIAPKPMGCHPHKCCLNEAPMLLLWCNPSPKSQVRRPLRYGATGVQSHPILVTVTACRLWPTSAPKRRPAIDPKRAFTTLFTPTLEIPRQFRLLVLPGQKRAGSKPLLALAYSTPTLRHYFWNGKVLTSACSTSSGWPPEEDGTLTCSRAHYVTKYA